MTLLDENIKTIIGGMQKSDWKKKLRGTEQIWELKDEHENTIGKFAMNDKKYGVHSLYQSDDSVLIRLHDIGNFLYKGTELRDSGDNLLGKINRKTGLMNDTFRMENSKDEKILECKDGWTCHILDNNKNTVAELKMKRMGTDWALNILNPSFDRIMILGFSLEVFMMIKMSGSD